MRDFGKKNFFAEKGISYLFFVEIRVFFWYRKHDMDIGIRTHGFTVALLVCIAALLRTFPSSGQNLFTAIEDFDHAVSFTPSPAALWDSCSRLHATAPYAWRGLLPQQAGDSSMLTSPTYDLSACSHVYLVFDHICKISMEDLACIEIKEDFLGARWHSILSSCYMGKENAYRQQRFSDNSYRLWQEAHPEAVPDNGWWKTECFDLSGEAAYAKIQLRFKIKKGTGSSGRFAYGWLIDNIRIHAGRQAAPPLLLQLCEPVCADEMECTGPFRIGFRTEGCTPARLRAEYTVNGKPFSAEILKADPDTCAFIIPRTPYGQTFTYTVSAADSAGNETALQRSFSNPMPADGRDSNAAIIRLLSPGKHIARTGAEIPLRIQLKNTGIRELRQVRIRWSYDGVSRGADWNGQLPADYDSDTLTPATLRVAGHDDSLKLWIESVNGETRKNTDTLCLGINACSDFLHGTYRIGGKDADFADLESALQRLEHCGLSGSTAFAMDSGTYALHLDLNRLDLGNDSLYFTSATGNAADVVWTADSSWSEIVRMANVRNLCFRNLTFRIDSLHLRAGSALLLDDSCRNIRVEGCRFLLHTADAQGITSADKNGCSGVDMLGNTFSGGRFGVLIWGNITHDYRAVRAERNTFDRQSYCGLYLMAVDFSRIAENTFLSSRTPTLTDRSYTGLELYGCYGRTVERNRFRMYSGKYAMDLGIVLPDSARHVLFSNNEIHFQCGHAQSAGILLGSGCRNVRFLHNSIFLCGRTAGNCCVSVSGTSDSIAWINNLLAQQCTGSPSRIWNFTQPVHPYLSDHFFAGNHYFVPYGDYLQTDRPLKRLEEWQQLHGQDAGASEGEIRFADTARSLAADAAYPLCFSTAEVPADLEGSARNSRLTTKGAHHSIGIQQRDALVFQLLSSGNSLTPGDSLPLRIVLANAGSDTLHKAGIGWEWNGIRQNRTLHFPDLGCGDTLHTDTLAQLPALNGDNTLKIWTYLPDDTPDECPANDTLHAAFYACDSALSGDYLVGAEHMDFPDLESALRKARHCGIRGPVRFLLASGKYSLQLDIEGRIPGSSAQNTLTLTSLAQNADSVRICCGSYSDGQRAAIRLSHTSHWTLEHLSIDGAMEPSDAYSIAVELMDSCTDIRIRHCMLRAQMPGTSLVCCGIYSSETTGDSLSIQHNILEGGMFGISLQGYSPTSLLENIRITDNTFRSHTVCSIFLRLATFQKISGNRAENLCLQTVNGKSIQANRFHSHSHDRCMQLTEIGTLNQAGMLQISNNECISDAPAPHCGLDIGPYCHDLDILHNSFSVIGNGEGKCLQLQDDPTLWNIRFRHNLFYQGCLGSDTAVIAWSSLRSPSAYSFSDNLSGNPSYADSAADLRLKKGGQAVCLRLPEVPDDIDGQPRTALTGMGAHALPTCGTDACMLLLLSPGEKVAAGSSVPVCVLAGNLGDSALEQLDICWEAGGILQDSVRWQGRLEKGDTASVFLGNLKAVQSTPLRIWLKKKPGDLYPRNDTLLHRLTVCDSGLEGELRIGRDFTDLESALEALYRCGIAGNVRIVLPSGTFRGPFDLNRRIPGSDSLHRLTLTADSLGGTVLTLDNTSLLGQYILRCGHTGHWNFENLCFEIPEKQQEACAIQLLYDCEDIRVEHCRFNLQEHSQAAVYQHTDWGTDGFEFSHNCVMGGRNGLLLSASGDLPDSRLRLCDNLFTELSACGISLENASFTEISRNTVEQKKSSSTGFYGMKFQTVKGDRMDANRIRATRGFYGMYLSNTSGNSRSLQIGNNEIHLNVPSSNCGIYLYNGCGRIELLHNSVLLEGNGMGKCLYTAFNLYNITLRNNQFTNLSGKSGSTDNPVMYFYAAGGFSGWQADHNHYYTAGQVLMYAGGNCADLKDWQLLTAKDLNSCSFRPAYTDKSRSLRLSSCDSLSCPLLPQVPADRDGLERSNPTQQGCYQATSGQPVDWELAELESPEVHTACPEAFQSLRVRIRNAGRDTLQLDRHPLCIRIILEGAVRMEQHCCLDRGCLAPLHSESFTLMERLVLSCPGKYTLTLIVEDAEDNCRSNDTLTASFTIGRTFLPYSSNMENAADEMEFTRLAGNAQWFTDTSATDLPARCGKAKLCFPSAGQRGSIARASLGYLDLSGLHRPVLSVWYARNSLNKSETDLLRLLVSTESDSLQEVAVLYRYKAGCSQSVWERADIDLSAYAGKCVRIVWEGIGYGGGNLYIDSLHLEGRPLLQWQPCALPKAVHDCTPDAHSLSLCVNNPSLQPVREDSANLDVYLLTPGSFTYSRRFPFALAALSGDTLTVDDDFPWECGNLYRFEATLGTPAYTLADTLKFSVSTRINAGLKQLTAPPCSRPGDEIHPSAVVYNSGDLDIYGIPVEILINDTLKAYDTLALLRYGESLQYTFRKALYAPVAGDSLYDLEIRLPLECDCDFSDNSCFSRACLQQEADSTAIAETASDGSSMQIHPNPSRGEAYLLVRLESGSDIRWEIISPEGQLLHRAVSEGKAGVNRIRLPRLQQAKGLLFIRVRCGERCWTGKWIRQ